MLFELLLLSLFGVLVAYHYCEPVLALGDAVWCGLALCLTVAWGAFSWRLLSGSR